MLCWGKLNSEENDSSRENMNRFDQIFHGTRITDVSITEGLATFLRDPDRTVTVVTSQKQIDLKKERTALLSSGKEHVVLVSETGTVQEWKGSAKCNKLRPFSSLINRQIAQVACGNYHSIVLTKDGQLFTWGQNSSGQLGLGKGEPSSLSPQPQKSLHGIPLAQISAGGDHSFALSLSGAVFGWGRNSAGQLGLGDTDDRHVPVYVKSLNLKKTMFISCGEDHTAVLTKDGLVLTFGSGHYGQLGHNSLRDELLPRVVAEFWGSKVSQIACGRTLVKMFHSVCAHFMSLMTTKVCDHWTEVIPVLKVLQKLYDINSQRVVRLTEAYFLIKELSSFFDLVIKYPLRVLILKMNRLENPWESLSPDEDRKLDVLINFLKSTEQLTCYPFILDIKCKIIVFQVLRLQHREPLLFFPIGNTLCVNRERVLADTLVYLKTNRNNFSLPLKVIFSLENGIDDGGVRAEFFTLLGQEITKRSGEFQTSEDSGLLWFSADDSHSSEEEMFYIGVMCGLAFYNQCFMNIGFPVALFKKLLNLSPTFSDLEELLPVEARCLKSLLMEDEDIVEELYLDFTVKGRELIPNGAEIPVTTANRQKYVDMYVDFVFNESVKSQFRLFEKGFSHGNPFDIWRVFKPEELRDLLYGTSKYEWEELQKGATYEHCGPSDDLIQNFWCVFFELNEEHKKKFLTFIYATDRLPVGGLSKQKLKIVKCNYEDADDRFPSAQTCYGILHLPNYSKIHVLRSKFIHAITYCEVFGQQ